ncbi:MAG: DNA-3-methyladenine glycosylase [Phycisphaerae bacterium]|jgi:DNA-3-methyladenine glycosylase
MAPLPRTFYARDPATVARALLGKRLIRTVGDDVLIGRIVEAEAYLAQHDPASHSYRGRTRRNAAMFGPPGHAYVYTIHTRFCLNAVTEATDVASAVLIRAVEPLSGMERMAESRGIDRVRDLARGPGRLCEALNIDRGLDGWDLTLGQTLWIADAGDDEWADPEIIAVPRVGISVAQDLPLRFLVADNPFISKPPSRRK